MPLPRRFGRVVEFAVAEGYPEDKYSGKYPRLMMTRDPKKMSLLQNVRLAEDRNDRWALKVVWSFTAKAQWARGWNIAAPSLLPDAQRPDTEGQQSVYLSLTDTIDEAARMGTA